MGANVQFNSYISGYYNVSSMDVNGNSNGNSLPLTRDGNLNSYNTSFLSTDYLFSYNKQVLKQTMLKHEIIFKDQIQELHRLYKRQKELMDEIRRNEFRIYLKKSETSNSNMAFFQVATEYVQKNLQVPTTMMMMMNPSSGHIPVSGLERRSFLRVGKKILDLQLPADEYIDCDEDEKVAPSASQILYANNGKSFFAESHLNCSAGQNMKSDVQKYLLEESVKKAQKKLHVEASTSFLSYPDKTGVYGSKLNSCVQGSDSLHKDLEQIRLPIYSSESSRMNSNPLNNDGNHFSVQRDVSSHPSVFDDRDPRNPIAVQALPCFKRQKSIVETPEFGGLKDHNPSMKSKHRVEKTHDCSTSGLSWLRANPVHIEQKRAAETYLPSQTCQSKGKPTDLDLNMACDLVPESEPVPTSDELVAENKKGKGSVCVIDLNSSVHEVDFHQKPSLDLDAPSSPENKECSPPRGESEGNQAQTVMALSDVRIAAEAILSFAKEESSTECLEWFAGIVSWVASNDNRTPELELSDDEIDFFEAMTLNLEETKTEQCHPREEESMTSSSPGQQKKGGGRARRGRGRGRKDFQREILPSLASLSRYEVTEDLQTIGGLMEAAGSTRNGRARRRAVVGCSAESLLKKLSGGDEGRMGSVICWGKVTRRRRGQRCPIKVCNQQQLILTEV